MDIAAAAAHGVPVTHSPGVLSEAVADMNFGLIIAARRRIVEADRFVRTGGWTRTASRSCSGTMLTDLRSFPDVLPFSNIPAFLPPFPLRPDRAMTLAG